ncbi:MAG: hypothetical protein AB1499_13740 [Nitrospirota bacterium]
MRKGMVVCIAVAILLVGALSAEAYTWYADYPYSPDDGTVYDRYSWDGYNHLSVTWNDTVNTVSAVQMNPDGVPNLYYWGDIYSGGYGYAAYMYLYYSYDGYNWYYAGTYYYY